MSTEIQWVLKYNYSVQDIVKKQRSPIWLGGRHITTESWGTIWHWSNGGRIHDWKQYWKGSAEDEEYDENFKGMCLKGEWNPTTGLTRSGFICNETLKFICMKGKKSYIHMKSYVINDLESWEIYIHN